MDFVFGGPLAQLICPLYNSRFLLPVKFPRALEEMEHQRETVNSCVFAKAALICFPTGRTVGFVVRWLGGQLMARLSE